MRIGIPKEVMNMEGRVALGPPGAGTLVADGHAVIVQAGAGANSSNSAAARSARPRGPAPRAGAHR